jgi:PAS domain S-box-containing protein
LRSPATLFQNLVDFAPDALLLVDLDGRIVFANSMAEKLFGFSNEDLTGSSIERLVPQRLRPAHVEHRSNYLDDRRTREMGTNTSELKATRRDGTEVPVEIRLSTITVEGQSLIAAAVRDITDRRMIEDALRAARDEAQRANEVKGRFLAAASHDLRQPLQSLHLLNGALQRQVESSATRDLLASQQDIMESMSRLLNALLDISKLEAGNVKPDIDNMSVARLFADLRHGFESVALARGLSFSAAAGPYCIRTDPTLFRELMENLVSNAIKYTQSGSVLLTCEPDGDGLLISVADTGIGIAPEQLGAIFDDFYQVDRHAHQHGAGLGLAIVKRLVKSLDLSIHVESEPGRGSQFRISVPASQISGSDSVQQGQQAAFRTPGTSSALILLVEDDDAVRHATALYLKSIGYSTVAAAGIDHAELILDQTDRIPDLVITDFHLGPDDTGSDLIRRLRARFDRALPVLLLSGDTSTAVHDLVDAGTCQLLNKPVSADRLASAIAQLLLDQAN